MSTDPRDQIASDWRDVEALTDALIHTAEAYEHVRYLVDQPIAADVEPDDTLPAIAGLMADAAQRLAAEMRTRFNALADLHHSVVLRVVLDAANAGAESVGQQPIDASATYGPQMGELTAKVASAAWRYGAIFAALAGE